MFVFFSFCTTFTFKYHGRPNGKDRTSIMTYLGTLESALPVRL